MDGVQLGHCLDNVFAFRAGLGLKIGLGEMAAEAGVLHGPRQAWDRGQLNTGLCTKGSACSLRKQSL